MLVNMSNFCSLKFITDFLTSAEDGLGVLDGGGEDAECVVQRPLGLAQDLLGGAPDDDGARLAEGNARELEQGLVADHHLLDDVALADLKDGNKD